MMICIWFAHSLFHSKSYVHYGIGGKKWINFKQTWGFRKVSKLALKTISTKL